MLEVMELEPRLNPSTLLLSPVVSHNQSPIQLRSDLYLAEQRLQSVLASAEHYEQWHNQMVQVNNALNDPGVAGALRAMQGDLTHAAQLLGQAQGLLFVANLNLRASLNSTSPANQRLFAERYWEKLNEANRLIGIAQTAVNGAESFGSEAATGIMIHES
jgi:hypothetical protein